MPGELVSGVVGGGGGGRIGFLGGAGVYGRKMPCGKRNFFLFFFLTGSQKNK